jgi:hypothetical protein
MNFLRNPRGYTLLDHVSSLYTSRPILVVELISRPTDHNDDAILETGKLGGLNVRRSYYLVLGRNERSRYQAPGSTPKNSLARSSESS